LIDISGTSVTISAVDALTVPDVALMSVVPSASGMTRPPAFTVATVGASEDQVTALVTSCVLPSVKVPAAVNCSVLSKESEGFAGLNTIDTNTAGLTVKIVEPKIVPELALMVVVPAPTLLASP
jgi:hypothetical protein